MPARTTTSRAATRLGRSTTARGSAASARSARRLSDRLTGATPTRALGRLGGRAAATTTGSFLLAGSLLHVFFPRNNGADSPAECDGAFDLQTSRVELSESDVLIGDVSLAGLEPLGLRLRPDPLPRLALRPETAVEEQRLDPHRRSVPSGLGEARRRARESGATGSGSDRALERRTRCRRMPRWTRPPTRSSDACASIAAEFGESTVVQAHVAFTDTDGYSTSQCVFPSSSNCFCCARSRAPMKRRDCYDAHVLRVGWCPPIKPTDSISCVYSARALTHGALHTFLVLARRENHVRIRLDSIELRSTRG